MEGLRDSLGLYNVSSKDMLVKSVEGILIQSFSNDTTYCILLQSRLGNVQNDLHTSEDEPTVSYLLHGPARDTQDN